MIAYTRDRRRFFVIGGRRQPSPSTQAERAEQLLETLIALGPTFIKLGQLLSSRPDILPPVYIETFGQLQDDVPPAPWEPTMEAIEASLGPIDEWFDTFDQEAISGASLGQVYRASVDGKDVAVKVRRPQVTRRVEIDLRVLAITVPILVYFLDDARAFSLENLADEFAKVIREEMDYEREARMLRAIRTNFAEDATVRIPAAVESHCTDRVLTMEFIAGTKVTDVETLDEKGIDRSLIAERLERAYLQMVIEDGVFHADPHPGNIAVDDRGRIIFYDFGMSGSVAPSVRTDIVRFYLAVAERDIDTILDAMIALGTLSPDADRRLMAEVLELAIKDARGETVDDWRVEQIVSRVESTMYEFPLRLPARLALVMRVATVVEGVCITLDPDFDFIEVATGFLVEQGYREESIRRVIEGGGKAVGEAAVAGIRAVPKAERLLDRFDRNEAFIRAGIEDTQGVLDRLALRLTYALLLSANIVGATVLYGLRGAEPLILVPIGLALLIGLLLFRSFRRGRRAFRTRPQFTRQALRERREK